MDDLPKLNRQWMVAVWPGMGHVAISAGYSLLAKLEMHVLAEFSPRELFDVEHIEVKAGIIRTAVLPRSCLFVWIDPERSLTTKRDLSTCLRNPKPGN